MQIVVVSPFLDRSHGTELCVVEQIERLSSKYGWGIRLYSQRVENVKGLLTEDPQSTTTGFIRWYKVPDIPGPHLLKYLWWLFANQTLRSRAPKREDQRLLVYSPGINCLDADAITVHIVFHEFYARVRPELALRRVPVSKWPVTLHRKLYYELVMALERRIYTDPRVRLAAVSKLVATQLEKHFGRTDSIVIPNAVDTAKFSSEARLARRSASRDSLKLNDSVFVLLLIGNDWKKKGLDQLLQALAAITDIAIQLIVVGNDAPGLYQPMMRQLRLEDRVRFLAPSADVLLFYAAADAYVAPSLEDAFGLPIMEAMACGLPVIASVQAGASENILDGTNGYLLRDPMNHTELAEHIRRLVNDRSAAERVGAAAAQYVQDSFSWDDNTSATREFLENALSTG